MKGRDELSTATLRMVLSAVSAEEVAGKEARELSDDEVQAVLVTKDALVLGMGRPRVFVVDPETSIVRPVEVDLGIAHEGMIQVHGAVKPGMRVVVRGNERLRPGQKVIDGSAPKGDR